MKIFKKTEILIFSCFVLLHVFLLNINVAEWGDSYRILRASEYIRNNFSYPKDEKRPPLFSALLAIRPDVDPIFWGKIVMLVISIASFIIFEKLTRLYIREKKYRILALALFALNPIYLYWSLRIYADVPFTLFALVSFYLLKKWETSINLSKLFLIGLISGLSVLVRFEGYLLVFSIGLALLLNRNVKEEIKKTAVFVSGVFLPVVPYLIYRNPLTSTYFEEPSGRTYDLNMFLIFVMSLLFLMGFTSAFFFIFRNADGVLKWSRGNVGISIFILLELLLILAWPAAVPRLFVPIIPFIVIILINSISKYFEEPRKIFLTPLLQITTLLIVYIAGQYFLKLQFLILYKWLFVAIIFLQLINIYSIYSKKYFVFTATLVLSMFIWSLSTLWLHRNNLTAIKHAAEYAQKNLEGIIGYNDVSSVSDWYLNQSPYGGKVIGKYYPYSRRNDLEYPVLLERGFDYLILTNEHNTDMSLDLETRPYLELVKEYNFEVGGKSFFAKIIKIQK